MTNETVDNEETIGVLVLITPLQHLVACHDLLQALVTNAAFETDERLGFVCCSILTEFSTVNPGSNLFSFTVLGCDERATNDIRCVDGWWLSTIAHRILHG